MLHGVTPSESARKSRVAASIGSPVNEHLAIRPRVGIQPAARAMR